MPKDFPRPCLECGRLTTYGTRCEAHTKQREQYKDNINRPRHNAYYNTQYKRQAKLIRDNATHCWICKQPATNDDPITADHLDPGNPHSPLAPAHRSCNSRRGNTPLPPTGTTPGRGQTS